MAFCHSCGSDIGDSKFCSQCGSVAEENTTSNSVMKEVENSNSYNTPPPVYAEPVYSGSDFHSSQPIANTGTQSVLAIINVVLGLLCCCNVLPLGSLVLGIIALVKINGVKTISNPDEVESALKTIKILNIIGLVLLGISFLFSIISFLAMPSFYSRFMETFQSAFDQASAGY